MPALVIMHHEDQSLQIESFAVINLQDVIFRSMSFLVFSLYLCGNRLSISPSQLFPNDTHLMF